MNYQLIVFDWDGTLYDSGAYIIACLQKAAKVAQIEVPSAVTIKNIIGLNFNEALERVLPNLPPEKKAAFEKSYQCLIDNSDFSKPILFDGAKQVLQQLHDKKYWMAIATGKIRADLQNDLTALNINHFFMTSRCGDEAHSKPHPQMLLEIMDELSVDSKKVLMVGDTEYDMQLAFNANVDALAVDYGMHERERLLKCNIKGCLSDIKAFPKWLAGELETNI